MRQIDRHSRLSALWLFILLNILFRDIHQFVMPGFLESFQDGSFNGVAITEELMLLGGIVVSVPIGMVLASLVLVRRVLRPLTGLAAALTTVTMVPLAPRDLDDLYHLALQLGAMAAIVWSAWRWPADAATAEAVR
ncbi:DUF6326 family protein [uncultured Roseobacter sp.]|uniref:DUF6326 family protein n=1 Tax=uncultured Roseobacter sp. TaxID=114847 RepID=UPI002636CCBD|nr:DUF6326 family protein [uncultured Roseobacter sp.]